MVMIMIANHNSSAFLNDDNDDCLFEHDNHHRHDWHDHWPPGITGMITDAEDIDDQMMIAGTVLHADCQ
jgi:hypothetical protein